MDKLDLPFFNEEIVATKSIQSIALNDLSKAKLLITNKLRKDWVILNGFQGQNEYLLVLSSSTDHFIEVGRIHFQKSISTITQDIFVSRGLILINRFLGPKLCYSLESSNFLTLLDINPDDLSMNIDKIFYINQNIGIWDWNRQLFFRIKQSHNKIIQEEFSTSQSIEIFDIYNLKPSNLYLLQDESCKYIMAKVKFKKGKALVKNIRVIEFDVEYNANNNKFMIFNDRNCIKFLLDMKKLSIHKVLKYISSSNLLLNHPQVFKFMTGEHFPYLYLQLNSIYNVYSQEQLKFITNNYYDHHAVFRRHSSKCLFPQVNGEYYVFACFLDTVKRIDFRFKF